MSAADVPIESVQALATRYIEASVAGRGYPQFTMDELDRVREFVNARFTSEESHILHVYLSIEREFAKGHRCSVCGRTKAQSEAIDYDCVREC